MSEVDIFVMCVISYFNLGPAFERGGDVTVADCTGAIDENRLKLLITGGDMGNAEIFREAAASRRFGTLRITDYEDVLKPEVPLQFSACTFRDGDERAFICFRGTDETIAGWKEDFMISFTLTEAQTMAAAYAERMILADPAPRYYIAGHSKGGNTALVSAMAMKGWRQKKIRAVYSNDGPGLRKREIESEAYKAIRPKFKHIVPHCSIVGMLLRHDTHFVVKSNQRGIFAHLPLTWEVMDDKFRRSVLTTQSQAINKSLVGWLDQHDDATRTKIVNDAFDALYAAGMDTTMDLRNAKKLFALLKDLKKFDKETRDLALSLAKYSYDNIVSATKKDANLT